MLWPSALSLIHKHHKNEDEYKKWNQRLLELGGFESVDETWISAVEDGLNKLTIIDAIIQMFLNLKNE